MAKKRWESLPFEAADERESLSICGNCSFAKERPLCFVPFEIVGKRKRPDVLFVAESPWKDEMSQGRPLIGKAGAFLRGVIDIFGLESYALANVVSCHPTDAKKPESPPEHAQEYCVDHVRAFIKRLKPKMVVLLGKIAYMNLFPSDYLTNLGDAAGYVGQMQKKGAFEVKGTKYAASYHPSYIIRNGGTRSPQYTTFKNRLEQLLVVQVETDEDLKFGFYTLDDLPRILRVLEPIDVIGFDYESRMLDTWHVDNKPIGFSFAYCSDVRKGRAFYISVDRDWTEDEKRMFVDFLRRKSPWTYNAKFEGNLTWSTFGEQIQLNDAYVLCKIDCSPGSLKNNSQLHLGANLWEEEVYSIVEYFGYIFGVMKAQEKAYPELIASLREGRYKEVCAYLTENAKAAKKFEKVVSASSTLRELIGEDQFIRGIQKYPFEWEAVPVEMLGEYCCWDAYYTVKLRDFFWPKYKDYYQYYITQTWLAQGMEAYSANWDDEHAKELNKFYVTEAIECLLKLIDMIDLDDEHRLEAHQHAKDPATLRLNDRLKKVKEVFNPMSNDTAAQQPFWSAYRNPYTECVATMFILEKEILQHEDLDEEYLDCFDRHDPPRTLDTLIEKAKEKGQSREMAKIIGGMDKNLDFYFQRFATEIMEFHYEAHSKYGGAYSYQCPECNFVTDEEQEDNLCPKCEQTETYKKRLSGGINVDNRETWTPEFEMMYLLRRFKKVMKSDSTYIWGKVGRKSVFLSDVSDVVHPPRRKANYYDIDGENYTLKPGEKWILNTSFLENTADCLTGDTLIRLSNGSSVSLDETYNNFDFEKYETLTVDRGLLCNEFISEVIYVRDASELIELTLENGRVIRCTPNHRFLLKTGVYKQAKDLMERDDLWSI
jgi:uracil-DNA glycosylase family 4